MPRAKSTPASLSELLGKDANKDMSLKDLPKILGEKMPELPMNRIGRYRLNNALRIRFGAGFKNIPGVKNILEEFDKEVEIENIVKMNKESKNG